MISTPSRRCERSLVLRLTALLVFSMLLVPGAAAQWVEFVDETATRLSSTDLTVGVDDVEEKDYAWGDVDKDGDIDLVVVRKEPFTSPGARTNVLFLNENGVLTDRTLEYATDSSLGPDQGFHTATNDRDVQLVDLNGDTWLDIVTAVTLSDGLPKHIGHPRIYINQGEDAGQNWLGFRYEDALIPAMLSYTGQGGFNPRFCSVAVGDLTGDGRPDLWFGDYDASGAGGFDQPAGADYNDRLLVNTASGAFLDETQSRFSGVIQIPNSTDQPFDISAFGAAGAIADMNGDGVDDIIKQTSLTSPLYVGIAYNDTVTEGFFDDYEVVNNQSPYFISVGDLNNDTMMDIVITDDGADRYLLNQGNGPDGRADFIATNFSYDAAGDDGFGSNSVIEDLNNDGWNDVLIADVDVDSPGCGRRMHIFRNLGGIPGDQVTLREETTGSGCATSNGNPASCIVASIPSNLLEGVHDVAVFDIDGDGWKDMVVGRCTGTEIYMNVVPTGLTFSYPVGLPFFVPPNQTFVFQVKITGFGGATLEPGTVKLFASVNGGGFVQYPATDLGGNFFEITLPAAPSCTDKIEFYLSADAASGGGTFTDPPDAPTEVYDAVAALGSVTTLEDDIEGDVSGWTIIDDPSLTSGGWEQADPNGTFTGGEPAAPDEDAEAAEDHTQAFVTENGAPGGGVGDADVDGGPTDLITPLINLDGTDGTITYSRWFFSTSGTTDELEVSVTTDSSTWVPVETVTGGSGANEWQVSSFRVGDYVTPSQRVQVRFRTTDSPNNSVTEAGIDLLTVDAFACTTCGLPGDCLDSSFCNGQEQCTTGFCSPGVDPCPGQQCDEGADACVECTNDGHCDDGDFCNGEETCVGNVCTVGADPCPGQQCDENADVCVDCLVDAECSDGVFCNGVEQCVGGTCAGGAPACPGQPCDEVGATCLGTAALQPKMGDPLFGLTNDELDRFIAGKAAFNSVFDEASGLGPTFNENSCGACHNTPSGGSGTHLVTRFGMNEVKSGGFDPLEDLGGSLLQANALTAGCEETVPPEANVTANRLTNSTLGFGLVEAIPDADLLANATSPPAGVSGSAHMVEALEDPGPLRVGRFGWKCQVATVLTFSADAALNEMGITNRLLPNENAPNGDMVLLSTCDTQPDPEDGPDAEGFDFIDRVTDFQRFLGAPPQTPRSGMSGETHFNNIGCNACHIQSFTTLNDPSVEVALRGQTVQAYSDFLLHNMGLNSDHIEQGGAGETEIRTAPLWGLRVRDPLWHDGRIGGGTFNSRVRGAISLHNILGSEARTSAQAFNGLTTIEQDAVIAFLDSLGRAEFDHDGDNDVDVDDYNTFQSCFTGPGGSLTPDDACSISDIDRDGDVDDDDFALFVTAADGEAGSVSELLINPGAGNDLSLTWDPSCLTADGDYEVYEGDIGDYTTHQKKLCSTSGVTNTMLTPGGGSHYYLVVPTNGFREGSYGADSSGTPRPPAQGTSACLPQGIGACP